MTPPDLRIEGIFHEALDRAPAEREAFVSAATEGDESLQREVQRLLAAYENAGTYFEPPNSPEIEAELARLKPEEPGERIGPYKLMEQIGEGGFGTVWVADQEQPVRRRVALKIIKLGMDTKEVISRFEQERQALAMMDHPHIAKVFDAGATQWGRPFFVMELVRGIKISEYCDQANLPTAERLQLFIAVCQAVQHAHQKGIIHRDLKPSNILVTLHDGVPVPKVIDFGVAKATQQQRLTDLTVYTQFEQMIGTPLYMSPEQAEMSGLDIDTRSDIYSLGVLLYELLTGRTPFDPDELMRQGLDEIRRTIREVEPQTPSMFINTMADETRAAVAQHRQSDPTKLTNLLRGDLDWIVMKALEKDRTRRYETANAFAQDIARFLADQPVSATPPSAGYRFRKFARRNKSALGVAALFAAVLLVTTGISTWLAVKATDAGASANEARKKAVVDRDHARASEKEANDQRQLAEKSRIEMERHLYVANMNLAQAAWDRANIGAIRRILKETREYPERGFEWFYWQRQTHLDLKTLYGHTAAVNSVAISPDGRRIVTGSADSTARIWDSESGRELFALHEHTAAVNSVAFSPDGRWIATGSEDRSARIWDAETGGELFTLRGYASEVRSVAFSPDGKRIATGNYRLSAQIWDAEKAGRLLLTIRTPSSVGPVAFSPDNRRIATGGEASGLSCRVWDAETGEERFAIKASASVPSLAYSPDGRWVLTAGAPPVIWDSATGRYLFPLKDHQSPIMSVAFSGDGRRMLTGGFDNTARIWDAQNRTELQTFKGHAEAVTSAVYSPDGRRVVTGSQDRTAKIWDVAAAAPARLPYGHYRSAAFSGDGRRILTNHPAKTAKIWEAETGGELLALAKLESIQASTSVAFSPDARRILTNGADKVAKIWDAETGRELLRLAGHTHPVSSSAYSPNGRRIVTGSKDGTARIWDAETGRGLLTLAGVGSAIWSLSFSPDGRRILASGAVATLWDAETGRKIFTLDKQTASVAFSPDGGRIVTGNFDKTASIWDAGNGREQHILGGHAKSVSSAVFSPDGRRVLTGSGDATARIWDAETGREFLTFTFPGSVWVVLFSPDGQRVFAGGEGFAVIMTAATPREDEGWRELESVESQKALERDRLARLELELSNSMGKAIQEKDWEQAAAKLALVEKTFPDSRREERNLMRLKILMAQDYSAACQFAAQLSDARLNDAYFQHEIAWQILNGDATAERNLVLAEKIAARANDAAEAYLAGSFLRTHYMNTLARVWFIQGKTDAAIQLQTEAVSLAEGSRKEMLQRTLDSYREGKLPKLEEARALTQLQK